MIRQSNCALQACVFVLLLVFAMLPLVAHAQAVPDLVVTLRDASDTGIAGATITVRDRDGTSVVAQSQTDASGSATITNVEMSDVRVEVTGKASNGTVLKQLDSDTEGIALFLDGARTTTLALRVEDDGTVIPDPQAMSEPETVPVLATAPVLTVVAPVGSSAVAIAQPTESLMQPTAALLVMASPVPASTMASTVPDTSFSFSKLVGFGLLALVVIAVIAQLLIRAWREGRSR